MVSVMKLEEDFIGDLVMEISHIEFSCAHVVPNEGGMRESYILNYSQIFWLVRLVRNPSMFLKVFLQ